ncbi:hypothetical protein [uncultured Microbacterium sp.]|uniref:hypothetical protein n=1 Tax=uncultured Microbacterium sp. TaxID=191216 RepID=UPI0028D3E53D|nr:hypothetical protein [uncultured Microbacterium sp.]
MVALIVVASLSRLWRLGLQPYWVDETWSLGAASLALPDSLHTIKTEIHPPTFQLLLWGWIRIGGVEPEWTRLLGAVCGVAGVWLAYWLLRASPFPLGLRLIWVASVAVSGFAIVYSQDVRSYSLAWLVAVALTAMTLRLCIDVHPPARVVMVSWVMWGAIGSGIHLFNALLVLCAAIAIGLRWRSRMGLLSALASLALLPQILWLLLAKLIAPGFAGGSSWIPAPVLADLVEGATTLFAADGLHHTARGFVWGSPAALLILAVLTLALISSTLLRRRRGTLASPTADDSLAWLAARVLGTMLGVALLLAFVGAQVIHVWTARNLIVLQPAAAWSVAAVLFAYANRLRWGNMLVALAVGLLTLNLISILLNMSAEYKPASTLTAHLEDG